MKLVSKILFSMLAILSGLTAESIQAFVRPVGNGGDVASISIYPDRIVLPKDPYAGIAYDVPDEVPPSEPTECDIEWGMARDLCTLLWDSITASWKASLYDFLKNCMPRHVSTDCGGNIPRN